MNWSVLAKSLPAHTSNSMRRALSFSSLPVTDNRFPSSARGFSCVQGISTKSEEKGGGGTRVGSVGRAVPPVSGALQARVVALVVHLSALTCHTQ
jgi:hypothetical protein